LAFILNSRETDVITENPYQWGLYATLWDTLCRFKTVRETVSGENSAFLIREDVMVDMKDSIRNSDSFEGDIYVLKGD
jgi:hypothetical protein